jgi:hypothetical protein
MFIRDCLLLLTESWRLWMVCYSKCARLEKRKNNLKVSEFINVMDFNIDCIQGLVWAAGNGCSYVLRINWNLDSSDVFSK